MEFPIVLKRKRTVIIIINSLLLAISAAAAVIYGLNGGDIAFYIIAFILFSLSLAFNTFLVCEPTYIIERDRIRCVSRFIPKAEIPAKDIADFGILQGSDDTIKLTYNTDEYGIRDILLEAGEAITDGMWAVYIRKKDINIPLGELMLIIGSVKNNA